jgi:hypothetical protein
MTLHTAMLFRLHLERLWEGLEVLLLPCCVGLL